MKQAALLFGMVTLGSVIAQAQTVQIHVITEGKRSPIVGAIVKLVDSDGVIRASALSNETGHLVLRAPRGGSYHLRGDRIGFVGLTSGAIAVPETGAVAVELEMPDQAVVLAELSVRGTTRCGSDPTDAAETAALWSEIRKALDATMIGRRSGLTFTMVKWRRTPRDEQDPLYEGADTAETPAPRPFAAVSPRQLADSGYVIGDWRDWTFFGPDEETLLSGGFLTTHCFGLAATKEQGEHLVGLHFEPAPDRKKPDIAGTLWVEAKSHQLRFVEYEYRNPPDPLPQQGIRGRVAFTKLPEGWWIVQDWYIRMPRMAQLKVLGRGVAGESVTRAEWRVRGYVEDGGSIIKVKGPARIEREPEHLEKTSGPAEIAGR